VATGEGDDAGTATATARREAIAVDRDGSERVGGRRREETRGGVDVEKEGGWGLGAWEGVGVEPCRSVSGRTSCDLRMRWDGSRADG
jgi:hypothetical protein